MLPADVQPIYINHFDQWPHKPFDAVIEDGDFMGRGVDDNKGNLLMALQVSMSWDVGHQLRAPCELLGTSASQM